MAVRNVTQDYLGRNIVDNGKEAFISPFYASTYAFSNLVSSDKQSYMGKYYAYNTSTNNEGSLLTNPTDAQLESVNKMLSDPTAINLSEAKTFGTLTSTTDSSFFSTFYNYYLGLAQDRQANLSKNLGRSDLLSNNTGSLL